MSSPAVRGLRVAVGEDGGALEEAVALVLAALADFPSAAADVAELVAAGAAA